MVRNVNMCSYKGLIFVGFFSSFVTYSQSVTEADIKECGSLIFGRVLCNSVNSFYRECIVPGATSIDIIKVHQKFTDDQCVFKDTFGFRGNAVWVNNGCRGEFYVCFEGVRVTTDYPVLTVTVTPPRRTPSNPDVASGSTSGGSDNVVLYIVIVVAVVVIVGMGLLVGCLVKQRQHRDHAKRLAEKRQASIDQRANQINQEENYVPSLPVATRSLSMESIQAGPSTTGNGDHMDRHVRSSVAYEHEGSECSTQSSMSEFTSVSAQITRHIETVPASQSTRRCSLSDIHPISSAGIYSELGAVPKLNRSNQSSLESIREVCNKYQMVDIPIERRYKKKSHHRSKYSTVGFNESRSGCGTVNNGTMTLPIKRAKLRALVHVSPPHVPQNDRNLHETGSYSVPFEQHYHDPDMLIKNKTNAKVDGEINILEEDYKQVEQDKSNEIFDQIDNENTSEDRKNIPIYATVTKSCLKTSQNSESQNHNYSVSFREKDLIKKENNNNNFTVHGKQYSYLKSFRPQDENQERANIKTLSMDLTATKC